MIRLKHQYLKKESIANLYVLCVNSYNGYAGESYGTGHSMPYRNSNFLKEQQLKAAIEREGKVQDCYSGRLNNLYPSIGGIKFEKIIACGIKLFSIGLIKKSLKSEHKYILLIIN